MNKKLKDVNVAKTYKLLESGAVVLITTNDGEKQNACPLCWKMPLDFESGKLAMVIAREHKTWENLNKNGKCIIAIPTFEQVKLITELGSKSGKDANKLNNVKYEISKNSGIAMIEGCSVWIEAELDRDALINEFLNEWEISILKVTKVTAIEEAVDDNGVLNIEKYPSIHYFGSEKFAKLTF